MRVQIAGVYDEAEAKLLLEEGVDDLAFPLGPGVRQVDIGEGEAARLIRDVIPPGRAVLITYLSAADEILAFCRRLGVGKVQVHGGLSVPEARKLKERDSRICLIKSLVVGEGSRESLLEEARELAPWVDEFFTDTFDPRTGARGATGKVHDWTVSRSLVEQLSKPVWLAGGLDAGNVAEAIRAVKPYGVDAHTGVEGADGRKDRAKVKAFVRAARL